jgi:hypothetical protein
MNRSFGSVWAAIVMATALAAGSAQAGWLMTHGSATLISDDDSEVELNWRDENGLTVIVKPDKDVILVIPMPTPGETAMQLTKVKVSFWTGFSVAVRKIRIYDGSELVSETVGNWWGNQALSIKVKPREFTNGMVMRLEGHASFPPDFWWRRITIRNAGGFFKPAP